MKPEILLWDSDGVLEDSLRISMQNFIDSLKPYVSQFSLPSYQEIFDNYLGATEEEDVVTLAKSKGVSNDNLAKVKREFIKIKKVNLLKIPLFKGIGDVVFYSYDQRIRQALVTGRDKASSYSIWGNKYNLIRKRAVHTYFDYILAGDDYPGKLKAFELVRQRYNVKGENVLVLGDEAKDILCGKKLGFVTSACLWGTFEKDKLLDTKPDFVFDKPKDLLGFLMRP
ncbi:MAG: HAD hydrolase-like protein [Parcubacteria group bacterium]|jgi:phosphoglycolate phosphatase-like HAD superfamily hydrolase